MARTVSERAVIFLIGAVQFINILDFMMVMPLGPDFAADLGIPSSRLGLIGGSYTAAACISGFLGSYVLERFDRRKALFVAVVGLVLGTLAGGFATGLGTLLSARVLAGFFGGPATSLSLSVVADLIPAERRGKALGAVMGAFSAASVVGVPVSLELARIGGWRLPFFAVAALGILVSVGAVLLLPPLRGHLQAGLEKTSLTALLARPEVRWSYAMTALVMMASFVLIPNFSAFFQFNLGYPREHLGYLYMGGGAASFIFTRLAGRWVDRMGPAKVVSVASVFLIAVVFTGMWPQPPLLPIALTFVLFMVGMSLRNVSHSTLTSLIPRPYERARFLSIQSSVQHFASASAAFLSSALLTERADRALEGMHGVLLVNLSLTAVLPFLFFQVERRARRTPVVANNVVATQTAADGKV